MKRVLVFILLAASTLCSAQRMEVDTILIKEIIKQNEASKFQILQLTKEISDLKLQLQKQLKAGYDKFAGTSLFLDAAISSVNTLQSLVTKDSCRPNKVEQNIKRA